MPGSDLSVRFRILHSAQGCTSQGIKETLAISHTTTITKILFNKSSGDRLAYISVGSLVSTSDARIQYAVCLVRYILESNDLCLQNTMCLARHLC